MTPRAEQQFERDLIEAIKVRPFLYDHEHPQNKHTTAKAIAWKEISKICDEPAERCLARWKSLRDRYLREYKASQKTKRKPSWVYYNSLRFLDKHLKTIKKKCLPNEMQTPLPIQSTSRIVQEDFMEGTEEEQELELEQEEDYSNDNICDIQEKIQDNKTDFSNSNPSTSKETKGSAKKSINKNARTIEVNTLDEPEIDFDVVGVVNRFHDTIKTYKELTTLQLQKTEDENFGALVADMLSTLTVERRTRAKAHLMQYLANLHLKQLS